MGENWPSELSDEWGDGDMGDGWYGCCGLRLGSSTTTMQVRGWVAALVRDIDENSGRTWMAGVTMYGEGSEEPDFTDPVWSSGSSSVGS